MAAAVVGDDVYGEAPTVVLSRNKWHHNVDATDVGRVLAVAYSLG